MFSSHLFHVNAVFQVIYLTRLQCIKVINVAGEREYEYVKVIKLLRKGESMRNVAKLCDVSLSSVQRIKKEFGL